MVHHLALSPKLNLSIRSPTRPRQVVKHFPLQALDFGPVGPRVDGKRLGSGGLPFAREEVEQLGNPFAGGDQRSWPGGGGPRGFEVARTTST